MKINGFYIDETEVLDARYSDGLVFTVADLIAYIRNEPRAAFAVRESSKAHLVGGSEVEEEMQEDGETVTFDTVLR